MVRTLLDGGALSFKPGTFNNVNCLAQSLETSKDGMRIHFKLKQGVEFHGGYGEMTSEDVKYSYERIAGLTKPNIHAVYQGDWNALRQVKPEGKYAGTIILKQTFAPLGRSTLPAGAGLIMSKKAVEKLGKKFATHPIGTGPYEFTSWTPKQKIVMTRFDKYAGSNKGFVHGPFFEQINVIPIVNDSAAETALRAGDIDFTEIATGSVERLKADSRFQSVSRNTLDYQFLAMNVTDPLLKDINLRMAIRTRDRRAGHHPGRVRRQVDARQRDHPARTWASATGRARPHTPGTSTRPRRSWPRRARATSR